MRDGWQRSVGPGLVERGLKLVSVGIVDPHWVVMEVVIDETSILGGVRLGVVVPARLLPVELLEALPVPVVAHPGIA